MPPAYRPFPARRLVACAVALLALACPRAASAGEAHYLLMFGCQRIPNNPNYAHSFGVFVRLSWPGPGPCPPAPCVEAFAISWLPCNLVIRTLALCPEPGCNFDLHTTLRYVLSSGERVSLWGPYLIDPDLTARAARRRAELESGRIRFKAIDSGYSSDRVTNCIHALSTIAEGPRLRVASPGWGEVASYAILLRFRPWILDERPCYAVSSALGLDAYPIIYRDRITGPRSGALFGPIYRLLGGERDLVATYGPPGP